jgi:hypothetical protein
MGWSLSLHVQGTSSPPVSQRSYDLFVVMRAVVLFLSRRGPAVRGTSGLTLGQTCSIWDVPSVLRRGI